VSKTLFEIYAQSTADQMTPEQAKNLLEAYADVGRPDPVNATRRLDRYPHGER
jgi:hypothetical protein